MATSKDVVRQALQAGGLFSYYMPDAQRLTLLDLIDGEEGDGFVHTLVELMDLIGKMPKSYETDGQGKEAVAYLHYFGGPVDAWVTERDIGDDRFSPAPPETPQLQAFGMITLSGNKNDAELGYICILELIENSIELDLYWNPKTLKEVMA